MKILSALKSPYVLGSIGTTGVGGAGIIGWQFLASDSTSSSSLWDVDLNTNSGTLSFSKYGCSDSFFPGAQISHRDFLSSPEADNQDSKLVKDNAEKLKIKPSSSDGTSAGDAFGCALMKMSQDLSVPKWYLNAEITVKNDRIGWALWISGYGQPNEDTAPYTLSTYYQSAQYRLIFLEKGSGANWEIKAGYTWGDKGIKGSPFKIHVSVPGSDAWIDKNSQSATQTVGEKEKTNFYAGIWESDESDSGSKIFEGIELWGDNKNKAEILGGSGSFNNKTPNKGYTNLNQGYDKSKGNWVTFTKSGGTSQYIDISNVLTDWYKPFENKKGTWKNKSDYCSESNIGRKMNYVCGK